MPFCHTSSSLYDFNILSLRYVKKMDEVDHLVNPEPRIPIPEIPIPEPRTAIPKKVAPG